MAMKAHQNRRYNESTLVIGVDIAKRIHVAVAEGPGGTFSKPFNVANTEDGFKGLEAWIAQMVGRYGTSEVVIAFEPTGHYWKSLVEWLVGKGYALRLVSPVL